MGAAQGGPENDVCLPVATHTSLGVQRGGCTVLQVVCRSNHQDSFPRLDQQHLLCDGQAKDGLPQIQVSNVQLDRVQRGDDEHFTNSSS